MILFEDTQLEPYLEQLMSYLITRMQTTTDIKEKTMVVSALGAIGRKPTDIFISIDTIY